MHAAERLAQLAGKESKLCDSCCCKQASLVTAAAGAS